MHPIRHAVRTDAGVKGRPFATGEMHEEAHRWNVRDAWRTTENPRWEVMAAHYYFRYLVRYESLQGVSHDHARH